MNRCFAVPAVGLLLLAGCHALVVPDAGADDGGSDGGVGPAAYEGDGGPLTFVSIPLPAGAMEALRVAGDAAGNVYALLQLGGSTRLLVQVDGGAVVPMRTGSETSLSVTPGGSAYLVDLSTVVSCDHDCAVSPWSTVVTAQGTDAFTTACFDGERPYLVAFTSTSSLVVYEPSATAPYTFTRHFVAFQSAPSWSNCVVNQGTVLVAVPEGVATWSPTDAGVIVPTGSNAASQYSSVWAVGQRAVLVGACGEAAERDDAGAWAAVRPTACGTLATGSGYMVAAGHHPAEFFAFGFGPSNVMVSRPPAPWHVEQALTRVQAIDAWAQGDNVLYVAGRAVDAARKPDGGVLLRGTR